MNEDGGNGYVHVEQSITLNNNELSEAIFHYLVERKISISPGIEIEWNIDFHDG